MRDLTREIVFRYRPTWRRLARHGDTGLANRGDREQTDEASWTFLTNHSHVLLCLAEDAEVRMRDVAERVGITERAVQRIVSELEAAGYLTRNRAGRRNHYQVNGDLPLRHPVEGHRDLAALIAAVLGDISPTKP
ncbi:MAG: winged helix-turn-helix domain-containing protein [Polyangiales bacterium]